MAFQPKQRRTLFAIYNAGRWTLQDAIDLGSDARLVPFSPGNNLIKNEVVLLPSEPMIYGSEEKLVADIQQFIHHYVDLDTSFEKVATYYVILTWLYDAFNELPYLRFRGDYGTGKTRALLILGSLCYKGFFASGASTVSPIFHTLDAFRGTLIFDEADLLLVPDNGIHIHDDRSGLALPRCQDRCWNRTDPCFFDHKPRDAWQRFGSFRYASLVVFCSAACGSKKRDRNRDGYFAVEVTHAVDSHSVCSRMHICVEITFDFVLRSGCR